MTLRQLNDAYLEQYDAAPASVKWLKYNLETAAKALGDKRISEITAQEVATWRKSLPESRRHPAHRALRQVLAAALRWKWIEENPAALVKNTAPRVGEIDPFDTWEEIEAIVAELDLVHGVLVEFLVGWTPPLHRRRITARSALAPTAAAPHARTWRSRGRRRTSMAAPLRAVSSVG